MAGAQEIPELTSELLDMSREYLRQETIEPLKNLGKHAGYGLGAAAVISIGGFLLAWGLYYGLVMLYPVGDWFVVLARLTTAVAAAIAAGILVWRIQDDG
ncbi:MAG: phage holin family protein [Actinobacteria bacterium]|nr:phage holin family protein [Actinomycetota bacterium]